MLLPSKWFIIRNEEEEETFIARAERDLDFGVDAELWARLAEL